VGRSDVEREIDHLAQDLTALVLSRKGRLSRIEVTCPADLEPAQLKVLLTARLAKSGLDFVDIYPRIETGAVRLISAHVEPPHVNGSPKGAMPKRGL
jgi:hypothetical protein